MAGTDGRPRGKGPCGSQIPRGLQVGMVLWCMAPSPRHLVAGWAEEMPEGASEARREGEKAALVHLPGVGDAPGEEKILGWPSQGC